MSSSGDEVYKFLIGDQVNNNGWSLIDVWNFSDQKIESTHTFIQWVFPTSEVSKATPGSPTLNDKQVEEIRNSAQAKSNLSKSAKWYLNFLERNNHWRKSYDHNHLRITRMIKSLRLLCGDDEADFYKEQFWQLLGSDLMGIPSRTVEYWEDA